MSNVSYQPRTPPLHFGEWLRQLRAEKELPLRTVAAAADMDQTHLSKIELGQRLPTEDQTAKLATFFGLDEMTTQARRIAEKFRQEFQDHPAAPEAISILAETAGVYATPKKNGKRPH